MENLEYFDMFCLLYNKCLPYGNIHKEYMLELAISGNSNNVIQFLLNQGAKYTLQGFINSLSVLNFNLCDKMLIELSIDNIQNNLLDYSDGVLP
jgi:hypothetical protein